MSLPLHQDLGAIGLAPAFVHAAVLVIDRSVPYILAELLVPFSGPCRPIWVGISQLTMAATAIVVASFYLQERMGQKAWRRIHYLSFLTFLGATVHGLMAGSDSGAGWVALGYLLAITLVAFLLTYGVLMAAMARRAAPRRTAPPRGAASRESIAGARSLERCHRLDPRPARDVTCTSQMRPHDVSTRPEWAC